MVRFSPPIVKLLALSLNARLHQDGTPPAVGAPVPLSYPPMGAAHPHALTSAHGPTGYRVSQAGVATGMMPEGMFRRGPRAADDKEKVEENAKQGSASFVKGNAVPKVVIWDVDGTLVPFTRMGYLLTNGVLRHNGHALITEEQYEKGTKFPTAERFAFHITGDPTKTELVSGPMLAEQFETSFIGKVASGGLVELFPGIKELLADLKAAGITLAIFSNACGAYVHAVTKALSMESDFEYQLGADEVEGGKPAPDGLLKICSSMGFNAEDCVYIGDSPTDGMAASAAGMRGVGVAWGASSAEILAHEFPQVVGSVEELRALLLDTDAAM